MIGSDAETLSCAEFTAHVLNINDGHNQELMAACPVLQEYSKYIATIRKYTHSGLTLNAAIEAATTHCIEHGILADVLRSNKAEVTDMLLTEYNEAFHIQQEKKSVLKKDGRQN